MGAGSLFVIAAEDVPDRFPITLVRPAVEGDKPLLLRRERRRRRRRKVLKYHLKVTKGGSLLIDIIHQHQRKYQKNSQEACPWMLPERVNQDS